MEHPESGIAPPLKLFGPETQGIRHLSLPFTGNLVFMIGTKSSNGSEPDVDQRSHDRFRYILHRTISSP